MFYPKFNVSLNKHSGVRNKKRNNYENLRIPEVMDDNEDDLEELDLIISKGRDKSYEE